MAFCPCGISRLTKRDKAHSCCFFYVLLRTNQRLHMQAYIYNKQTDTCQSQTNLNVNIRATVAVTSLHTCTYSRYQVMANPIFLNCKFQCKPYESEMYLSYQAHDRLLCNMTCKVSMCIHARKILPEFVTTVINSSEK